MFDHVSSRKNEPTMGIFGGLRSIALRNPQILEALQIAQIQQMRPTDALSLPVAIVLGILNVIIGLLLITCCCCCCCCACCKNRRPAAITVNTGFPQVSMMSLPQGSNNGHSVPPYSRLEEEPTFK
ncbi:hypothetical protein LSAT2_011063 [Lamellibrachia satsuma]|nr:hypothetical protein LSAT2_011063 [Lamellibrachia satsuma]